MTNSTRVNETIEKVFEELHRLNKEEFQRLVDKHNEGELAKLIRYGLDRNSTADSMENLQDSVSTTDKSTK